MTDPLGALIIDLQGLELLPDERNLLRHPLVGGVILFTRNYESREQLKKLCQDIRVSRKHPLLIMVDQEGGRVQRFIPEFTRLPWLSVFGEYYDKNTETACQQAKDCAWLMAVELLSVGIDLSLSPVLDRNKGTSRVIGRRGFHAFPGPVTSLALAFTQGMKEAGMASTGKHFPGHGSVALDSHLVMPVDDRPLEEIEQNDMLPFARMVRAGLSAMMAAHIVFPKIDNLPASFSPFWLKNILREKLGFKGVVFSDDLNMEGANISSSCLDRVRASREAGSDFVLLCNNRSAVIEVLDRLPPDKHQVDERWKALQGKFSGLTQPYHKMERWQKTRFFLNSLTSQQDPPINKY